MNAGKYGLSGGGWRARPTKTTAEPGMKATITITAGVRAAHVIKQQCRGSMRKIGQNARDPSGSSLHHGLRLKPFPGGSTTSEHDPRL